MENLKQNKVLVTGAAGFIGSALCEKLISSNISCIGIDNFSDSYSSQLKRDRLENIFANNNSNLFSFQELDICNKDGILSLFEKEKPDYVVNLAAQAGVRRSIENPYPYIETNIMGFTSMLEACRHFPVKHCVYASSSSVYGANTKMPFNPEEPADHPLSIYAATKRANELIAHSYSSLFNIPSTGLRFFTVYGPWGRPDMALYLFADAIVNNRPIQLFNNGQHERDFTYVGDIVAGILKVLFAPASTDEKWDSDNPDCDTSKAPWKIYNIGNSRPIKLLDYVEALEHHLDKKAIKEYLPLQPGDVPSTWADVSKLTKEHNYSPKTSIIEGVGKFVDWYKKYYKL